MLRVAGSRCVARLVVSRPGPRAHKRNLVTHPRQRIEQPIQRVLTPSVRPLVPRAAHTTEPVRLNDDYTDFADRIQQRYDAYDSKRSSNSSIVLAGNE